MEDMRGILILLAALFLLAGEPAVAAPGPPQDGAQPLDFRGLLYRLEQQTSAPSSAPVR